MSPQELRRCLARLDPVGPITEGLERALAGDEESKAWYETQQEHLLGWIREYGGPGYYGRANWDRTAEFVYNHFNCAPGLLWIAEAAGAPPQLLHKAKRAVLAAGTHGSAQSAAVRRVFPWEDIEQLLWRNNRTRPASRVDGRNRSRSRTIPRYSRAE